MNYVLYGEEPVSYTHLRVATFYHTLSNIIYQYLAGTMLDLLFIIVSVGIVLSLYRFPNALLYAMILALLNLFPYVGATLGPVSYTHLEKRFPMRNLFEPIL